MAIAISHTFVASAGDTAGAAAAGKVVASEWNAAHTLTGFGTGVATALAVNVGSAGAFTTFNGALGTPSSGTLTNCTGLPAAGVTGTAAVLGANTFTATQTINPAANTSALVISGGSITGSGTTSPGYVISGTLNTSGVVDFNQVSITNTASGAGSTAFNYKVGGESVFRGDLTGLLVVDGTSGVVPEVQVKGYGVTSSGGGGVVHLYSARGTKASPTAVQSGDFLGGVGVKPYNGSAYPTSSTVSIQMIATENQTTGAAGARLQFMNTPNGTTTRRVCLAIDQDGSVGFAQGSAASTGLGCANFSSTTDASIYLTGYGSGVAATSIYRSANGTSSSPTSLNADEIIGGFGGRGYAGGFPASSQVAIFFRALENFSSGVSGTYIQLANCPTGSSTRAEDVRVTSSGITLADARNLIFNTSTGTKIGTGTTQKIGFWNATPVVQQVLATGAGATVDNVITFLQTIGLCKQS